MENSVSINNQTKGKLPSLPFVQIKNDILGKKYSLSVAFISENKIREINNQYRKKNKATNILSFAFSKNEGEILLCPTLIRKETKKFNRNFTQLVGFLVIHGMLHLKGREHSSTMEKEENFYDQKYFSRN